MSISAIEAAFETKCATIAEKLILLILADHHNGQTGQCNPSIKRICNRGSISRSAAIENVAKLERAGLITGTHVKGVRSEYVLNRSAGATSPPETRDSTSAFATQP